MSTWKWMPGQVLCFLEKTVWALLCHSGQSVCSPGSSVLGGCADVVWGHLKSRWPPQSPALSPTSVLSLCSLVCCLQALFLWQHPDSCALLWASSGFKYLDFLSFTFSAFPRQPFVLESLLMLIGFVVHCNLNEIFVSTLELWDYVENCESWEEHKPPPHATLPYIPVCSSHFWPEGKEIISSVTVNKCVRK